MQRTITRFTLTAATWALAHAIGAHPVLAQSSSESSSSEPSSAARTPKWSVLVSVISAFASQQEGIESSMYSGGLHPDPGGCFIWCSGPASGLSRDGGTTTQWTIRRALGAHTHVRGIVGSTELQEVSGYDGFFPAAVVNQSVGTVAVLAGINTTEPTAGGRWAQPWVGVGPARFQPKLSGGSSTTKSRLGGIVATGLRMRFRGVLLELQLDYRRVGSTTTDSIPATIEFEPRALAPARVTWNHMGFSLGTGFRW